MSVRPTISAAIIAQDAAASLAVLLPQLRWADEIVLVDGGSRDPTVQVAAEHGCRVYVRPLDSFAAQRNFALAQATGDWVLSIDTDERPTPALVAEIRRRVHDARYAAFRVHVQSRIFGRRVRWSGTQHDWPIRLFRRRAARWTRDVHEVLAVQGRVGRLEHALHHDTIPDLDAFLRKVHRYTYLEAQARVAAGQAPRHADVWLAPAREVFRRLVWKLGILDGPHGWAFCLLSGLSEWVLAQRHCRYWNAKTETAHDACHTSNA